jgi:hypothetical protein
LSWTRVLPDGVAGSKVNEAGVAWYRKVLKGLLEAGIVSGTCSPVTRGLSGLPRLIHDQCIIDRPLSS